MTAPCTSVMYIRAEMDNKFQVTDYLNKDEVEDTQKLIKSDATEMTETYLIEVYNNVYIGDLLKQDSLLRMTGNTKSFCLTHEQADLYCEAN